MIAITLPNIAGAGFKPEHFEAIRRDRFAGFLEVHAENYMGAGGAPHAMLESLRRDHALSVHGVGLSIGGADPLDRTHLARLRTLCDRHQPASFSEHLAWSTHDGVFLNDLLPLPYTHETLSRVIAHVGETQDALGRRMLLENPATYLTFVESEIPEIAFLSELARRTGCGILLDLNNVVVSATNHGTSAEDYLDAFPLELVGEIHLAGHAVDEDETGAALLIDAHGSPVPDVVWNLYKRLLAKVGPIPTLIEWDNDIPEWDVLAAEAAQADGLMAKASDARRAA